MVVLAEQSARDVMIESNMGLVGYIVNKDFRNTRCEIEDLISVGTIGLIKGADTFNADKGFKFPSYAAICIRNEILQYLRKVKRHMNSVSLESPVATNEQGEELKIQDVMGTDKDMVVDIVVNDSLLQLIHQLDPRDQFIINNQFGLNGGRRITQCQIAKQLGVSQPHVARLQKAAIAKLRRLAESHPQ